MADERKMLRINKQDTTLECIIAHYLDPETHQLTNKQEEILNRYRFINQLLLNADSLRAIINKCKMEFGIEENQVYVDVRNTRKLFGNITEADIKGNRYIHYQYALANYKKACLARDLNAQRLAIQLMHELSGGNDDHPNFDPEKLKSFEYILKLPKHLEDFIEEKGASGVMDFNKISTEDAEFMEI